MRISGTAQLAAPPATVFEALNDPQVLSATIPGVQALDRIADDRYSMTISAGVASVKGVYTGEVSLSEQVAPHSFTLRGSASGAPGSVDAAVRVTLAEQDGGTRLGYDADAVVGGMVGGVGQRMLASVARRMADQFFSAVDRVIADGLPVVPAPRTAADDGALRGGAVAADGSVATSSGPVPAATSPSHGSGDVRVPPWVVLAGVGAGALWALAGVVVGCRLARGARR